MGKMLDPAAKTFDPFVQKLSRWDSNSFPSSVSAFVHQNRPLPQQTPGGIEL